MNSRHTKDVRGISNKSYQPQQEEVCHSHRQCMVVIQSDLTFSFVIHLIISMENNPSYHLYSEQTSPWSCFWHATSDPLNQIFLIFNNRAFISKPGFRFKLSIQYSSLTLLLKLPFTLALWAEEPQVVLAILQSNLISNRYLTKLFVLFCFRQSKPKPKPKNLYIVFLTSTFTHI